MSITAFAAHLGVTARMVSKWEAAGTQIRPRPVNQAALDTSLSASGPEVHKRFAVALGLDQEPPAAQRARPGPPALTQGHQLRHPLDGKLMALIDAGVCWIGAEKQPLWLPAFYLDVYPTTNADYARFVGATGHQPPPHWPAGRCPDTLFDHPVVFVTWQDATAYAAWAGKALPQAAQWEKAARGPHGTTYPWGEAATPAKCNVRDTGIGTTTPVGRYHSGVSPYGIYDLCGNVWEWCATATQHDRRELKGSAFTSPFTRAAPAAFNDATTAMNDDDTGFRTAASLDQMRMVDAV